MSLIQTRFDSRRGCGWRKEGGMYLVSDGLPIPCGKLPIPLDVCPCCGHGIKPSRGWTWINPSLLVDAGDCGGDMCGVCPIGIRVIEKAGLLWIGEQHYATPEKWIEEVDRQGVSRRISTIPRDFKLGETWVFVAHRKAILKAPANGKEAEYTPGVFHCFKPKAIEYVVTGKESEEKLEKMVKRGITPIKIEKVGQTYDLNI